MSGTRSALAATRRPDDGRLAAIHDTGHGVAEFRSAVIEGLSRPAKAIPCKFFYDQRGSALFDRICDLPEYYPTRTEIVLLRAHAGDFARLAGPDASLIEFGSGSSLKVRIVLDALDRPAAYLPVDISREHLLASAAALARDYPNLAVIPICADYCAGFAVPAHEGPGRRLGFFPGSTIGNFPPAEARGFLARAAAILGPGAHFLVGADLQKDEGILHAAYNDAQQVTAAFNLNLLARINRELGGDIDLDRFEHAARYDPDRGRIQMFLVSRTRQTATIAGRRFAFAAGEAIHTEDSYKYTVDGFQALARSAGWTTVESWTDPARLFSLHYLRVAEPDRAQKG